MNLRVKLLLGIGLALIVVFTLVAVFSSITMDESYLRLERQEVGLAVQSTASSFNNDIRNTYSVTRDYAAWTDTYLFTEGLNPGWIGQNTADDFFERFGISYVLVINRSGSIVYAKGYNFSSGEDEEVPAALTDDIRELNAAKDILPLTEGYAGILDGRAGPVIISSHPILHDNLEGPAAGTLHIVRRLDDRYLADLAGRAGHNVTIIPARVVLNDPSLAGPVSAITPGSPVAVLPENKETVTGYTAVDGLQEPGGFYLMVSEPRTIYRAGYDTIALFLTSLFGAGIFLIVFVLLFIDRIVLSRLNTIIRTVKKNQEAGDNRSTESETGEDELAGLAMGIDPVFSRLAESRNQLRESEERYRTLAESARDFIFIIDRDDRITYVNSFAAQSVGRTRDDLIGKERSLLFPKTESLRQRANIRRVLAEGTPLKVESSLPLVSGIRWHDTLLVPMKDRDGSITGVMGISRDITDRKRVDEALVRVNNKLNLLSGITRHDILNQLTALKAYIDLSAEHSAGDEVLAEFITREMMIANVIDRQISFTRDYHKLGVMAPVWQNVAEIIGWTRQSLFTRNITIVTDFSDLEVFADPLLEKVFYNLMDNALRYGGEKMTTIRFSLKEEGDSLIICCEDDGVGIEEDNKDLIFNRGYAHNTGLGLFLSREILGITEIAIAETGISGRGARFEIRVPKGSFRFNDAGKSI